MFRELAATVLAVVLLLQQPNRSPLQVTFYISSPPLAVISSMADLTTVRHLLALATASVRGLTPDTSVAPLTSFDVPAFVHGRLLALPRTR